MAQQIPPGPSEKDDNGHGATVGRSGTTHGHHRDHERVVFSPFPVVPAEEDHEDFGNDESLS